MTDSLPRPPGSPGPRVLFVTPRFWPLIGGVETHCLEVGRRLVADGVRLSIATTDPTGSLPAQEVVAGIPVRRFPAFPRGGDLYISPELAQFVRRGGWDLVHVQGYHTLLAPLAMLARLAAGRPYLVTLHSGGHSSRLRTAIRPLQALLLRPLFARARAIVAGSTFEAGAFAHTLRLPQDRFSVIPSGADLASGTVPLPEPVPDLIVSPGRLERYKGHDRVIDALPAVLDRRPDARLVILGGGPHEDALRRRAAAVGVTDRVEIGPVHGAAEVRASVGRASVVVSLSEYESQGLAVIEAVAVGRPVVAARTSAFAELADRGLVRPVPPGASAREVADALVTAMTEAVAGPRDGGVGLPTWDDAATALRRLYARSLSA